MKKTNAMRMLDKEKIGYKYIEYSVGDDVSGENVAQKLNQDEAYVFKTLVTVSNTNENFVFVVAVKDELDLKKCAKTCGVKKLEMIHVKDLLKTTGYIRGGCSPIGMKTKFKTFIDESCENKEYIYVSGGKIGAQIKIAPEDLIKICDITVADIKKE